MQPITVTIASPTAIELAVCKIILQREPDFAVVADSKNWIAVVESVRRSVPRVLLCGFDIRTDEKFPALLALHREFPSMRLVLLVDKVLAEHRFMHALSIGACAYVAHDEVEQSLARAVRCVDRGEAWMPRKVLGKMVELALR